MRYVLAIGALVLSGVLLLLGIGQRTFLAGPSEIRFPVDTVAETGYAVVSGSEFGKLPGQANVVVKGGEAFVATGAERDVQGWVAEFPHAELSVDTQQRRLMSALVAGAVASDDAPAESDAAPAAGLDPRGSDLWLEERSLDASASDVEVQSLRVPVSLAPDQAVLIASNGTDPVPSDLALVWVQDRDTPWAGPLLAAGGLFALIGGILYLVAIDHNRRGLGPRRGRRGPLQGIRNSFGRRSRRPATPAATDSEAGRAGRDAVRPAEPRGRRRRLSAIVPAVGVAAALGLSGCSADYWPDFSSQPAEETPATEAPSGVAPVPVTDAQADRIITSVAGVAATGDEALDAELLEERFTGDALAQRVANYKIRAEIPDYGVVPPTITDEGLDYNLVQSTETWPRTLFLTVASEAGGAKAAPEDVAAEGDQTADATAEDAKASPSLAMILTQQTPHDNYLVSRIVALRGGISMPAAAPAEEGTALLANDSTNLVLPPEEVGAAYATLLQGGTAVPEAESFDLSSDTLLESYGKARAEQAQKANEDEDQTVKFSATARQGDEPVVALSTGTGGALVSTTVIEEQLADAAGGRYKPQAKDVVSALSGLKGEQDKIVQVVAHQLLFYVPSKTDGAKIELLGVTSELVGARNE
ncbi:glycosyltransferase [Leucobacter zeae]|nr:glycosyltransferase [Leucobacter zeae]